MDWQESFQRYLVRYSKGEIIFHEGDLGNEMYVIQSGKVRIFKNISGIDQTLAVLEKGDFFGEMAVLEGIPGRPRRRSRRTVSLSGSTARTSSP